MAVTVTRYIGLVGVLVMLVRSADAEIVMSQIFGDRMVLQTNHDYGARSFMYGTAIPGETITIAGLSRRSVKGVPYSTTVDSAGYFKVQLDPYQGSVVYNVTISGSQSKNVITFQDVVYGDVILCAGESSMNKPLSYAFNGTSEIAAANHPNIRLFRVPEFTSPVPQPTFNETACKDSGSCLWKYSTPSTVSNFSGVCYLTAIEIQRIQTALASSYFGLIQVSVESASLEEFMSEDTLTKSQSVCPGPSPDSASTIFNGMIFPVVSYSVKFVAWYQGQSNALNVGSKLAEIYGCRYSALINAWRDMWGMGDYSWIYVQLGAIPGGHPEYGLDWPELRLQQLQALPMPGGEVDTTGMAVITDLDNTASPPTPKNLTEIGRRMALKALHVAYAMQSLRPTPEGLKAPLPYDGFAEGPLVLHAVPRSGSINLTFDFSAGLKLVPTAGCGTGNYSSNGCCMFDRTFEYSTVPQGSSNDQWSAVSMDKIAVDSGSVVLNLGADSLGVKRIRFAYQTYPQCSLQNSKDLIASPFVINVTLNMEDEIVSTAIHETSGVAVTPPMGFNSWNFYHCNIDERAIKQIAEDLKSTGLADLGYKYVNIDDCWQVARNPVDNAIVPDPVRFPSGLRAIADWLHDRDMLFGIYTAAHGSTCQGRPGSYLFEEVDSDSYCDFAIDYLKIDQCGGDSYEKHNLNKNISWLKFQTGFKKCLAKTGRPIVESVESCSTVTGCGEWIANCANLWRTGADLEATWGSVMKNLDATAPLYSLAGVQGTGSSRAGHWNDPDMLQVGNVGLTDTESRSHFAAWCFLAAPLLIGTDLHTASKEAIAILGAKELIAIDQDPLGFQGRVVAENNVDNIYVQIYGKKLSDGSVGVLLLNRGNSTQDITVEFQDVWLNGTAMVRDLWAEKDLGSYTKSYTAKDVPSHGNVAIQLRSP